MMIRLLLLLNMPQQNKVFELLESNTNSGTTKPKKQTKWTFIASVAIGECDDCWPLATIERRRNDCATNHRSRVMNEAIGPYDRQTLAMRHQPLFCFIFWCLLPGICISHEPEKIDLIYTAVTWWICPTHRESLQWSRSCLAAGCWDWAVNLPPRLSAKPTRPVQLTRSRDGKFVCTKDHCLVMAFLP